MGEYGDEQQIDNDNRDDVVAAQGRARRIELIGSAGDGHADIEGHFTALAHLVDELFANDLDAGFQRDIAWRDDVEGHGALAVDAPDGAGVDGLLDLGDGRERDDGTLRRMYRHLPERVERGAHRILAVEIDVDFLVIEEEFAHIGTVSERGYRETDIRRCHAELCGAVPFGAHFDQRL